MYIFKVTKSNTEFEYFAAEEKTLLLRSPIFGLFDFKSRARINENLCNIFKFKNLSSNFYDIFKDLGSNFQYRL